VGALGTGKTTLAQKLKYEGFLQGARVIDCDPKGDHRFHLLEEVAPHVECVTLRPDRSLRGMLDPMRVAPPHLRQDVAVSFLRDLLPGRAEPAWETAVVGAVDRVIRRAREPSCTEVVRALRDGDDTDLKVGKALEVYARSGLTQLGFADPSVRLPPVGTRQVTYLPIRDLPGPEPGLRRSEYSQSERIGEQIVRLIAMFAMHLMSSERERLKLFSFDEGWRLLGDPVGRTLRVADGQPEIIGVVGDVALGARAPALPCVYHSHSQFAADRNWDLTQVIALDRFGSGDVPSLLTNIRRELSRIDPALVLYEPRALDDVIGAGVAQDRFALMLVAAFAMLALLLAALGIYSMLSYAVSRRRREIGIRMALGAPMGAVRSMIVRDGTRLAAIGIAVGSVGALGATRFLRSMLFGVTATEPLVFMAAACLLVSVAAIASWMPARAATNAEPLRAVRE